MQLTNNDIYNIYQQLGVFANLDVKVSTGFKINKISKILLEEVKEIDVAKMKIVEAYCEKDEDGKPRIENGNYKILPEFIDQATTELNDLFDVQLDVNIPKIKLSEIEDLKISMTTLSTLMPIIEEDE